MRLEYLPEGSRDCPLIRLYDCRADEAARLGAAITELASGRTKRVAVHELPGVSPVGGCQLVLRVGPRDAAVAQVGPAAFECRFSAGTWENVAGLIEPFAERSVGYQWLAGSPGEIALLLSASGEW